MTVKLADSGCKELVKMAPCVSPEAPRAQAERGQELVVGKILADS